MKFKKLKYEITNDNRIVYIVDSDLEGLTREYTVWGVCERGFIHGAGTYIKRDNLGTDFIIIDKPTNEEFERYYRLLEKLREKMDEGVDGEEWKKGLDNGGEDWKNLLGDDEDDDVPF